MKAFVIGPGRWGSFIARYLTGVLDEVTLYGRDGSAAMREFFATRKNELMTLPDALLLTTDLTGLNK